LTSPYDWRVTSTRLRTEDSSPANAHGTFAALSVPLFARLWTVGLMWNVTRWMGIFLCGYFVSQETGSPFLVQVVGTAFFAPMFLTGAIGGVISDRLDRRRTMLVLTAILIVASVAIAAVALADGLRVWMVYPYILIVGASMVVDMTSRRAMVYDLVGPALITNALALEAMAMTGGSLVGSATGGSIVSAVGFGPAYGVVAVFYGVALFALMGLPKTLRRAPVAGAERPDVVRDMRAAFAYVRGHRTLVSILGVTVIVNLFYYSFIPMVPLFADEMGVNAFWAGVLASATGLGSIIGTLIIARGAPLTRGQSYVWGSLMAMAFLCLFAASGWYPLALVALVAVGLGIAGFSTMQSALVMITADDAMRGRALGVLSMCIGALPWAMLMLGGAAQALGPNAAVVASSAIGIATLVAWSRLRPEALRIP
jgi:MFS family permease